MKEYTYNTTRTIRELLTDERFDQEVSPRLIDDNTVEVPLFSGYEAEGRETITVDYGLEIEGEQQMTGVRFAKVVDPNGEEADSVDTDMTSDEAISMF